MHGHDIRSSETLNVAKDFRKTTVLTQDRIKLKGRQETFTLDFMMLALSLLIPGSLGL